MQPEGEHRTRDGYRWRKVRAQLRALRHPCWLCGRDIDYNLAFPHPYSFSVDHVVPLARGGGLTDWENLKAAHYRCNQRKGDRLVPEKPKRIEFGTSRSW